MTANISKGNLMDIKAISTLPLPNTTYVKTPASKTTADTPKTQKPVNTKTAETSKQQPQQKTNKTAANFKKALPYAAGVVVLAGLGFYLLKGRGKNVVDKNLKEKAKEELKEELKEIGEEIKEEFIENKKVSHLPAILAPKEEYICTGFSNGKPIYVKKSEVVSAAITPAIDGYKEIKNKINPLNDEIIAKIIKNKNEKFDEINRIIAENTKDGHINFNIMRKVAHDFSTDEAGRGADRFHQAAEILEQSYIREYIKPDGFEKHGVYNLFDTMKSDTELMSIYTKMPLEEAVNRINYICYNDLLKCNAAKDMSKETFFDKMFDRLIEKRQFKKYNDTFKIDGNFNDIMQINQGLRKNTESIINTESLSKAQGTPLERLTQIAQNEPDAHKAAYIMEKAILNDFMSKPSGEKLFSELEKDFLNNKVLFDIYKKMPKEQALQRVNAFRRFELPSQIIDSDNEHTLNLLKETAKKLGTTIN